MPIPSLSPRLFLPILFAPFAHLASASVEENLPSPERMLETITAQAHRIIEADDQFTGEVACWNANYRAERFLEAYQATGDSNYIAAAVQYFDALLAGLYTNPDGYRGWVGPYVYDQNFSTDAHVGDAILANHMLALARVIFADETGQLDAYRPAAQAYIDFARRDVIEKWDVRGSWKLDGPYGYYQTWPYMFVGRDLSQRVETQTTHDRLTYQFNKQAKMGLVALQLYLLTGEAAMREIPTRIARLIKSRLNRLDGHYVWNYWEPLAVSDLWSVEEDTLSHWVGVHPHRHYQILEVQFFQEAFHAGIVFDAEDMRRFVQTHDVVMWNGDFDEPVWRNSDAAMLEKMQGSYSLPTPPAGREDFYRGRPWTPLADFSENIRRLAGLETDDPVSFERRTNLPVETWPLVNPHAPILKMTAAIPAAPAQGEPLYAVSSTYNGHPYRLQLLDETGKEILAELYQGRFGRTGHSIIEVPTNALEPGTYRLRWTVDGASRDALFWLQTNQSPKN